jgi:2-methylcitrate dehydratase
MALGYEIECRLIEEVPVMIKGFDHTLLLAYSLTAALSKTLSLTEEQTAHALGIAGCSFNPLVTSRASYTFEWKGLASSFVAAGCMNIVLLAKEGLTGPISVFEGPKGFKEVYDMELKYDWNKEDFGLIRKCILKGFNAEVHTQSILEAVTELRKENAVDINDIKEIDITTFLTAFHIVGGGEYGDRKNVHSKEQADHSIPYLVAAALLDGQVLPEQLLPERIQKDDVQQLLKKVNVHTSSPIHRPLKVAGLLDPYTEAYPEKLSAKVVIKQHDGKKFSKEKEDYFGFHTRPFEWQDIENKFRKLSQHTIDEATQEKIMQVVRDLENRQMDQLVDLLSSIN